VELKEKNWLKAFLSNEKLPEMLEVTGRVTAVPIDPDLNGATMGQAWLILKGVPGLLPSMTDAAAAKQ
jgi:hypothetical protein